MRATPEKIFKPSLVHFGVLMEVDLYIYYVVRTNFSKIVRTFFEFEPVRL